MKKIAKLAVLLTALSLFFVGCQNGAGTTDSESNIDVKTIKLATPAVKTMSYPGVNMIAWDRVEGAETYLVLRDDGSTVLNATAATYSTSDVNISDGITYKYTVWALAADEDGTYDDYFFASSVTPTVKDKLDIYDYTQLKSSKKTVSVKARVPDYTNEALDICKYESKPNSKFVVNSKNITVKRYNNYTSGTAVDTLYVTYPTKAYLTYTSTLYRGNAITVFGRDVVGSSNDDTQTATASIGAGTGFNFYTNNDSYVYQTPITQSGEYRVVVDVSATGYIPSSVTADTVITVEKLDAAVATGTPTAKYTDDAQTTARLMWTPAKKSNGDLWPTENYVIYTLDSRTAVYTPVEAEVKVSTSTDVTTDVYYVDYTVADNKVTTTFVVVLKDGDKYESTSKTATLAATTYNRTVAGSIAGGKTVGGKQVATALDTDTVANDIEWTLTLNNTKQTFKAYRLVKDIDLITTANAAAVIRADFDETAEPIAFEAKVTDTTGKVFVSTQKDAEIGAYYMLVVFSEEGKLDQYAISAPVIVSEDTSVTAKAFTTYKYDSSADEATVGTTYNSAANNKLNDVLINFDVSVDTLTDSLSNYTFTLYRAQATKVTGYNTFALQQSDEWVEVATIVPEEVVINNVGAYVTSTTKSYKGIYSDNDLADGYYGYKLVTTTAKGSATYSDIKYETINTKSETTKFAVKALVNTDADGKAINADGKKKTTMFKLTLGDTQTVKKLNDDGTAVVDDTDAAKYINKGWTYTLYRSAADVDFSSNDVTQVWKAVKAFTVASEDAGKTKAFIGEITQVDDTADTYSYCIVATKEGCTPVVETYDLVATKALYDAE